MRSFPVLAALLVLGCDPGPEGGEESDSKIDLPDGYAFESPEGESRVSYAGQVFRHALLAELTAWVGDLGASVADQSYLPVSVSDFETDVGLFFDCEADLCDALIVGEEDTLQVVLSDISSGKNLVDKLAGNDDATEHRAWTEGDFHGWEGASSPEALVRSWFATLGAQVVDQVNGNFLVTLEGDLIEAPHLTAEGLDLQQLIQKFLGGGIAFSQGTDDYLDDDVEGKGLLSSHLLDEGQSFTELEHAWDEAFGYFGAARNYGAYTDEEVSGGVVLDWDGDNLVDLEAEYNWGHSVNASRRDKGAADVATTDFSERAWESFLLGRQLLADTAGRDLEDEEFAQLQRYRDEAVLAWESAIAATVVHYINEVLQDMETLGTEDHDFAAHARHWSEMKGFALGLQFNPRSQILAEDFQTFHSLVGDRPVLDSSPGASSAAEDLLAAREILAEAYGFESANTGDEFGEDGW